MALRLFRKFKKNPVEVTSIQDKTYEDRTLSELNVSPTSSGQYVSGYDESGNRIYTWDRKQSMGYSDELPEGQAEKRRKRWFFKRKRGNGTTYPGLYGDAATLAKTAELGIGTAMLATNPITGKMAGKVLTDWIEHPIGNMSAISGGIWGGMLDSNAGITNKVNEYLPTKAQLPHGSIGATLGGAVLYPYGLAVENVDKQGYIGNLSRDVVIRPFKTLKALFQGRYRTNKRVMRRNLERLSKAAEQGMDRVDSEYKKLTGGWKPTDVRSWKFLSGEGDSHYNLANQEINLDPLYPSSNIFNSNGRMIEISGHERTHGLEHLLALFGKKSLSTPGDGYYVPNVDNPVARRFWGYFYKAKRAHGASPDETWANYMGYKARYGNLSKLRRWLFTLKNSRKEKLPFDSKTTNEFIEAQENHLSNPGSW